LSNPGGAVSASDIILTVSGQNTGSGKPSNSNLLQISSRIAVKSGGQSTPGAGFASSKP
jgi:hypothetical protein